MNKRERFVNDGPVMPLGKYKDIPVNSIDDLNYLKWALENLSLKKILQDAIMDRINVLEFTHL